jgi:hypothetical protein
LVDAGRCSWTHKDWQAVLDAHGDQPTTAPFFTRIPWSCVANFQLAPNVRTLGSHIIKTEPDEGATPVDAAAVEAQVPLLGEITEEDRRAEEACMMDEEESVAHGLPDAAATATAAAAGASSTAVAAAPGSPEFIRAAKKAAAQMLHADKRKPAAKLTDEQKDQIYAIAQELQPRKMVWQVGEVGAVLTHAKFPLVEHGWNPNERQHRKSFAQIINKIISERSKPAKGQADA